MSHTFTTLMRRLASAGFKRDFARVAILPEWWDENSAQDPDVLPEAEIGSPAFSVHHYRSYGTNTLFWHHRPTRAPSYAECAISTAIVWPPRSTPQPESLKPPFGLCVSPFLFHLFPRATGSHGGTRPHDPEAP